MERAGAQNILPMNVLRFLTAHLRMSLTEVESCWEQMKDSILRSDFGHYNHLMSHTYDSTENVQRLWTLNLGEESKQVP
jgi:hypothetical protein